MMRYYLLYPLGDKSPAYVVIDYGLEIKHGGNFHF